MAREGTMSSPASSSTFSYLGIFQNRFAPEPPEDPFSKVRAWTPTLQLLVSRTESLSGHLYAARDSADPFVRGNEHLSAEGMQRQGTGRICMALGSSQRHKTQAALPQDKCFYN